jgi:RimJ/RimL family protein N-acetyltransferase
MRLRDVEPGDVGTYVRMRCDPVMMAELGGPLPREGIEEKVARDVRSAAADEAWIKMIVPGEDGPEAVAGSVVLWSHDDEDSGKQVSEAGWMVLPEFQGRGLAKQAVRMLLELARDDGRWGLVHAFTATTNGPSNAICLSLGFRLAGERDVTFAGRVLRSNHWVINPAADLRPAAPLFPSPPGSGCAAQVYERCGPASASGDAQTGEADAEALRADRPAWLARRAARACRWGRCRG